MLTKYPYILAAKSGTKDVYLLVESLATPDTIKNQLMNLEEDDFRIKSGELNLAGVKAHGYTLGEAISLLKPIEYRFTFGSATFKSSVLFVAEPYDNSELVKQANEIINNEELLDILFNNKEFVAKLVKKPEILSQFDW